MKVFADLRWPDKTGIGLLKTEVLSRKPEAFSVHSLPVSTRIGSPWSSVALAIALKRARGTEQGVFWSPGFVPPAISSIPTVVTVHDLLHLHYYTRFHVAYYNHVFKPLYRRCDAIITDSDYSRNEFLEWSGFPAERCFTVYLGVSPAFAKVETGAVKPYPFEYVLYPGNRRSYKNINRLLEAYSRSRLVQRGVKLVFTGEADLATVKQAGSFGLMEHLVFAGFVNESALVRLYQAARVVAFVSLYEGFGLPIVEAMAAGVPVLTSNTSSMAEIAGNSALLIDPFSVEAITAGLETLTFNEKTRDSYIALGKARASEFDWNTSARKVWSILHRASPA